MRIHHRPIKPFSKTNDENGMSYVNNRADEYENVKNHFSRKEEKILSSRSNKIGTSHELSNRLTRPVNMSRTANGFTHSIRYSLREIIQKYYNSFNP